MKKTYLIPAMQVELAMASQMLAGRQQCPHKGRHILGHLERGIRPHS